MFKDKIHLGIIFFVTAVILTLSATVAQAWTLQSPVSGYITNRKIVGYSFGDNWYSGYCGGKVKRHVGVDVASYVGEPIYAAYDGWVKVAQTDQTWGGFVTIDHAPAHTFLLTTAYWHLKPAVTVNTWVSKGAIIGYICYLSSGTHFHFGVRKAVYSNMSNAGALPQQNCGGYPAYPENFINPLALQYEYNYN